MQDAFATAVERWPSDGTPANPGAWIVTTARNRAIDRIRRDRTLAHKTELLAQLAGLEPKEDDEVDSIPDERLSLIFTCCHPALAPDSQVALTLREVCGLTTEEIATLLQALGCPAEKCPEMARQLDKRAKQLAELSRKPSYGPLTILSQRT